jgi:competence protein ComEC
MTEFEVIFVDVGQGDSTLVRLPGGSYLLVDVNRCPGSGIDMFKLLDDRLPKGRDGRGRLEYLAITHAHDDHITGMGDLYDRYDVGELWLPLQEVRKKIGDHFGEYQRVEKEHPDDLIYRPKGSRSPIRQLGARESVAVRCFSPPGWIDVDESLQEDEARRLVHENCMVLKLSFQGVSVMITGDSNLPCWQRIVGYYEGREDESGLEVLKTTILPASHHGSRTFFKDDKSDKPWLDALEAIDPETVIVSVGKNNRHDHPHSDAMNAYRDQVGNDMVLQTSEQGTMVLEVDADGTARLIEDQGPAFAEKYGWDDGGNGGPGGGGKPQRSTPPSAPPPGHERAPQAAPRRERYG